MTEHPSTPTKPKCKHTRCPESYLAWHAWAEKKMKTHAQIRCPHCGLWAIWIRKGDCMSLGAPHDYGCTCARCESRRKEFADEHPSTGSPQPSCTVCGGPMAQFGSCDMSLGGIHEKDNPPVEGTISPEAKKCINFKFKRYQCPQCGSTPEPTGSPQRCPTCGSNAPSTRLFVPNHRPSVLSNSVIPCPHPWHSQAEPTGSQTAAESENPSPKRDAFKSWGEWTTALAEWVYSEADKGDMSAGRLSCLFDVIEFETKQQIIIALEERRRMGQQKDDPQMANEAQRFINLFKEITI